MQPSNPHLTDLDRQRLIFHRIYQRALDLGTAALEAEAKEEQEKAAREQQAACNVNLADGNPGGTGGRRA